MDESTALLIVGGVLSFMGVLMNINPIKFDEDLLGAMIVLESNWNPLRIVSGPIWDRFRIVLGSFGD